MTARHGAPAAHGMCRGAALAGAALVLGGCSGPSVARPDVTSQPTAYQDDPAQIATLRAAAGLAQCPVTEVGTRTASDPGERLPELTLDCLGDGPAVHLADLGGTPYVINVWAGWCAPCKEEMPYLQEVYEEAAGRVGVIGVDFQDTPVAGLSAAADFGITFPSVQDVDGLTRPELRFQGPPYTAFVAADGAVVAAKVGQIRSADELRDLIAEHLGVEL